MKPITIKSSMTIIRNDVEIEVSISGKYYPGRPATRDSPREYPDIDNIEARIELTSWELVDAENLLYVESEKKYEDDYHG